MNLGSLQSQLEASGYTVRDQYSGAVVLKPNGKYKTVAKKRKHQIAAANEKHRAWLAEKGIK